MGTKKAKCLSGEALQITVKRREAKCKGEKERYNSLHLYREMALLVWRLLTLQPILLLHFLGIAPSSLHAGPPQLTALSAVLIGTPSPHPCVSAHLQMTRGLIRRKCFTLSSPRKSFMTQNYKPLREILSFRSLFSQFSVLAFWGFHPLIPPSIEFRYQSVCYHY